jgi:hypothetical protein
MKRTALLPLLVLAACAAPAAQGPIAAPSGAAAERGEFTLRQAETVIATERFTRSGDRVESELVFPGQVRIVYTATLAPDATVPRIELQAFPAAGSADAAPAQRSVATFRSDSVFTETTTGDSTQTARHAATPGALPYLNPSPVMMEQILRRARVIGGEQVEVPVYVAGSGGQVVPATVSFQGTGAASINLGGVEVVISTDAAGRILSGTVPAQNVSIERTAAATP